MNKNSIIGILFCWLLGISPLAAQLSFTGAGIIFQAKAQGEYPAIQQVLRFTPAADAGLQVGEVIWSVDGKTTEGRSAAEVAGMIKGEAGAVRTLVVGEDKRSVSITIRLVTGKCTQGDCQNGEGRIEEPTGNAYVGNFENGRFDGWGDYYYQKGDHLAGRYEGHFVQGVQTGEGRYMNYDLGFTYKGTFKADKYNGAGVVTFDKNHATYEGKFLNNEPSGPGKLKTSEGERSIDVKDWNALIMEATGLSPVAATKTQPTEKTPERKLGIDDDDPEVAEDLSPLTDQMRHVESKLSNSIEAYTAFKSAFKQGLNANNGNAEPATQFAAQEYKNFLLPFGESVELIKGLGSTMSADATLNELQYKAFNSWKEAMGKIIDMYHTGRRDGNYQAEAFYWANLNVDQLRSLLETAGRARRAM